ncbi:Membrane protein involved in the export of O-antigen and teichoic acid [Geodermatophilus amargosae]|uniref:Membrane protein involved in the export of O-antigen and teichoic acid n=1 Tax=Geodermatophilus amargosae TaxID=1296565 RepID=A0A1I6XXC8_9ACTN|nr:Membrane protein involved in the export of O-antigen and teichoic acid [Geodermatophilus amargosae]
MPSVVSGSPVDTGTPDTTPGRRGLLGSLLASPAARSGLLLLVCSVAGHLGNYMYYVLAARALTPAEFAEVSAMTGLATIALMPATGVQAAMAREIAALTARGLPDEAQGLIRFVTRRMALVQAGLFVVLLAAAPAAVAILDLGSVGVWLTGALWIVLGLGLQVSQGIHQGREHFGRVGAILAGPLGILRAVLLVPLAAVAGVVGALGALVLATVVGLVMALGRTGGRSVARTQRVALNVRPALVALAAFASLTNLDLLVAKVTLEPTEAGLYASAALLGKIALYGPSALALMLLPKVAARLEAGLSVRSPALLTMAATLATGGAVVLAIVLAPASLVVGVFGEAYADAYALAGPLAGVMTLLALVYVHIMVTLARGDRRLIGIVAVAAVVQAVGLLVFGDTPVRMVVVSAVVAVGVLVAHEASSRYGLVRLCLGEPGPAARPPAS